MNFQPQKGFFGSVILFIQLVFERSVYGSFVMRAKFIRSDFIW
jgi:hypothetical protein